MFGQRRRRVLDSLRPQRNRYRTLACMGNNGCLDDINSCERNPVYTKYRARPRIFKGSVPFVRPLCSLCSADGTPRYLTARNTTSQARLAGLSETDFMHSTTKVRCLWPAMRAHRNKWGRTRLKPNPVAWTALQFVAICAIRSHWWFQECRYARCTTPRARDYRRQTQPSRPHGAHAGFKFAMHASLYPFSNPQVLRSGFRWTVRDIFGVVHTTLIVDTGNRPIYMAFNFNTL